MKQAIGSHHGLFIHNHEVVAVSIEGVRIEASRRILGDAFSKLFVEYLIAQSENGFEFGVRGSQLQSEPTAREPLFQIHSA